MADVTKVLFQGYSQDNLAYEIWYCEMGAGTECDITPTYLKSVEFVTISPANAAAAATTIGYMKSTFVPGEESTVTVVGANNALYFVKLEGKLA